MKAEIWIIETTVEQEDQAHELAVQAVEQRLAACVQVDSPVTSHYIWNGACERSREFRLQFKLANKSREPFMRWLLDKHPYACPQILAWSTISGNPEYTQWVLGE